MAKIKVYGLVIGSYITIKRSLESLSLDDEIISVMNTRTEGIEEALNELQEREGVRIITSIPSQYSGNSSSSLCNSSLIICEDLGKILV